MLSYSSIKEVTTESSSSSQPPAEKSRNGLYATIRPLSYSWWSSAGLRDPVGERMMVRVSALIVELYCVLI